jgi:polyphosphate glucokinase
MTQAIGVDIGGTGIKAGVVNLTHGTLDSDRVRIPTPEGAHPADVVETVKQVLEQLGVADSTLPLGVAFPAIVKNGRTLSAANVSKDWIGFDAEHFFEQGLGRDITFVNDADAAGVAEVRHGAARDAQGLTIMTTLGTGIGSAFLYDGVLIPNSELGHLQRNGESIERWTAYSAMERESLSWRGRPGCRSSTPRCSSCSALTCSSSAEASRSTPTSSCRCSI